jgi:hypothetical protein
VKCVSDRWLYKYRLFGGCLSKALNDGVILNMGGGHDGKQSAPSSTVYANNRAMEEGLPQPGTAHSNSRAMVEEVSSSMLDCCLDCVSSLSRGMHLDH